MNYGVLAPDFSLPVRVHFDHRVMDGAPVARALAELETVMNTAIVAELKEMASRQGDLTPLPDEGLSEAA